MQENIPGPIVLYDAISSLSILNQNCENLVDLETVNEGTILHHIKRR